MEHKSLKMNPFSSVGVKRHSTNRFDLSHDVKFSADFGQLTPVSWFECLPGDRFNLETECMLRLAPMVSPVMHKVDVTHHWFFVPNRLLWPGWRDFIAPKTDDAIPPAHPYFSPAGIGVGDLGDYLGLPIATVDKLSALPYAAYQAIYNEYYRDQNLIDAVPTTLVDGANTFADFNVLRKRAWQHDYFTSCLPWPQKGPEVVLPIGDAAPVVHNNDVPGSPTSSWIVSQSGGNSQVIVDAREVHDPASLGLWADLAAATGISINDLRTASTLQQYYEAIARGGSRYIEVLKSMFGVRSSDSRLQRPEYITGNKQPVVISEVLQSSQSEDTPQGNMSGHGISVGRGGGKSYFCEEHGIIMCIQSVMPRTAYQQGLHKSFSRFDRFDYAWPIFANLGEQEVLNKELYYGTDGQNNNTFGYQQRYQEYRNMPSRVAGDMRTSLDTWHIGRKFANRPLLNQDFIEMKESEANRIFAVPDDSISHMYCHVFNKVTAVRGLPLFSVPQLG